MYYSWLLLFVSVSVFSNVYTAPGIPTNINIDIKLGKQNTLEQTPSTESPPGTHKKVLNAPFGLGSITITTTHKKPPCNPETGKVDLPPPPFGGLFGHPPPPHKIPGCNQEPAPSPLPTQLPEKTPYERIPTISSTPDTTANVDQAIENVFGNVGNEGNTGNESNYGNAGNNGFTTLTSAAPNVESPNQELTGEGTIDVRRPINK